ncbi:MAG: carbohydrate ABC transporter permease [Actinomycetota bacterium]|nr:carbohydrate ABC transporter permease [Actinomycetota bacterium]
MAEVRPTGPRAIASAAALYGVLAVAAILFLVPFYLVLRNGLSTDIELSRPRWQYVPSTLEFDNVSKLFDNRSIPFLRSLRNSAVVSILQTTGAVFVSSMAGYGLARIPYRFANIVFGVILATLMIPAAVTFVPSFVIVSEIGWIDTYQGLIIPTMFQAFAAFLFRQYFLGFPLELEEAARIDGLSTWGTYWRIVVPNSKGIFAAVASITFIGSWNAFLWPLVVGKDQDKWTVQVALSSFLNAQSPKVSQLFAASAIAILPLLIAFILLQRYIVEGVERTGING